MPQAINNGGGKPQGGTNGNAANPDNNNNGSALTAMDRFVQLQDAMDNQSGNGTNDNDNGSGARNGAANPDGQPEPTGDETDLTGEENANASAEPLATADDDGSGTDGADGGNANAQMPAQLAALEDDVREQFLDLAQDVADGRVNLGDVKRGHRLALQFAGEREQLESQITTLREQLGERGPTGAGGTMPEAIARLGTAHDVEARIDQVQSILDWCQDNPEGGDFGNGENRQSFSAEQVRDIRNDARREMRLLPKRAEQLNVQAQFAQSQRQARQNAVKLFPFLSDRNNADTKLVSALLESPMGSQMKRMFLSPEIAALTWVKGQAALKALVKGNGKAPVPNGRGPVPKGRPAAGGTSAGAQPGKGGPTLKSAKEHIQRDGSVGALAGLLDVVGDRFKPKTS